MLRLLLIRKPLPEEFFAHNYETVMMALKLDAICAKLKLNIAAAEPGISASENNNESKSQNGNTDQMSSLDRSEPKEENASRMVRPEDNHLDSTVIEKRLTDAPFSSGVDDCCRSSLITWTADDAKSSASVRRNRRKNFQPRFIQEVQNDEIQLETLASLTFPKEEKKVLDSEENEVRSCASAARLGDWSAPEQDEGVLDLRVADCSRADETSRWTEQQAKSSDTFAEDLSIDGCGVIDLSMHRSDDDLKSQIKISSSQFEAPAEVNYKSKSNLDAGTESLYSFPSGNSRLPLSSENPNGEGTAMNDYALQTMNKLLKIYGLSEDADSSSYRKLLPIHTLPSSNSTLWPPTLIASMSVLPQSSSSLSSSVIPEELRPSFSSQDLDLTKSSTSPSSQSMEASIASTLEEDASLPGLVKSVKHRSFLPSFAGFSSKLSLSKRSSFKQFLPDYNKYAKRFNSFEECNIASCQEKGYKEHFHCTACTSRVCLKKEEMIRHFKWHKKREDSLQHGFMRYSPLDDCSRRFSVHCSHNGKHTHYHCLQDGCSKVYISTSDVQMHANYHRKDSAIIQEGFQRFRATENCAMASCTFAGQKTTHFHCRRSGCNFTFKNKADMEKHKTYHQKDEILTRDGFKKFMKYEQCHYMGCHYSRVSNHIHCIRPGCSYVLHSTGQLYSHKRKHERREIEQAMFKQIGPAPLSDTLSSVSPIPDSVIAGISQASGMTATVKLEGDVEIPTKTVKLSDIKLEDVGVSPNDDLVLPLNEGAKRFMKRELPGLKVEEEIQEEECFLSPGMVKLASDLAGRDLGDSLNLPIPLAPLPEADEKSDEDEGMEDATFVNGASKTMPTPFFLSKTLPPVNEKKERDESWKRYLTRYTANDPCHARCQFLYKDHYHCNQVECGWLFRSKDGVREHAKFHEQQDRVTALTFMKYEADTKCTEGCEYSQQQLHYHCLWTNCTHVISSKDSVFSRLEHHKFHECIGRKAPGFGSTTSCDNLKRKRGRPPKFPKNDIPVIPKVEMTEEEIHTQAELTGSSSPIANGFQKYEAGQICPDEKCVYAHAEHYHCVRPRCHHVTNRGDVLALHAKDFHSFIAIADGFEFFDRNVNCRRLHCHNNQSNRHFHCVRPKCDYSFVRYSTMVQHDRKHRAADSANKDSGVRVPLKASPLLSNTSSASVTKTVSDGQGSTNNNARSNSALFPVSTIVSADGPVLISSSSVGLAPMLLTTLQPLSGLSNQSVAPLMVTSVTQGEQGSGQDLKMTSSLKLVSIAPKPATIMTFQTPASNTGGVEFVSPFSASAVPSSASAAPLTVLLKQKMSTVPSVDWVSMKLKMHNEIHQNCGRPFCKLKKKDHYHCFDCNQAFSDPARLKSHVMRHGLTIENMKIQRDETTGNREVEILNKPLEEGGILDGTDTASSVEEEETEIQEPPHREDFSHDYVAVNSKKAVAIGDGNNIDDFDESETDRLVIDLSSAQSASEGVSSQENDIASLNNGLTLTVSPMPFDKNSDTKRSGRKRAFAETTSGASEEKKSQATPCGYEKFRFSEDCGQERCAYRLSMTHYHCSRPDCGYSFCDHSRFLQHSDRHRRIDVIMGDQFQQFHAKTDCQRAGCEHARTATHFHCLLCAFVCTDSSKVVAHRKHHSKMDRIAENGFQKFAVGEDCEFPTCVHRIKQTHYHCAHPGCGHVVMGPAQMGSHKAKHLNSAKFSDDSATNFLF